MVTLSLLAEKQEGVIKGLNWNDYLTAYVNFTQQIVATVATSSR